MLGMHSKNAIVDIKSVNKEVKLTLSDLFKLLIFLHVYLL